MIKKLNALKNQKGMTLVELLAVMVIVGIIAAISIPAIGGLLENTRKDSFVANAVALQEAARLYYANNETPSVTIRWTKPETQNGVTSGGWLPKDFEGYLENFKDPSSKEEFLEAEVNITKDNATGAITYTTKLKGSKYQLGYDTALDAKAYGRQEVKNVQ